MPSFHGESANHTAAPPRGAGPALPARRGWVALLERRLRAMPLPPLRVVLPGGMTLSNTPSAPVATLRFHRTSALIRSLLDPDYQFGEAFCRGDVEIDGDLAAFLEAAYRAAPPARYALRDSLHRHWRNSPRAARRNIHHHYDLGNDFYSLWLDDQMLYTCAYYPRESATLEEAQRAKMELVCRKVQLSPGDRVVEAGCGWGGLACHMARHHGVRVRAFNISHEQIDYARHHAAALGLSDRVEFIEDDYRNIVGRADAFVSVGMLEHVGPEHYRELGTVIDRVLTPTGRGMIHTIGRHRRMPLSRWITARIFPGAEPPTLGQMMEVFEPFNFAVTDVENLRLHYARTCGEWLRRFNAAAENVAQRFDENFVRAWRLYLAGSRAAFLSGTLQLFQVVFRRHADTTVPRTRRHLGLETL